MRCRIYNGPLHVVPSFDGIINEKEDLLNLGILPSLSYYVYFGNPREVTLNTLTGKSLLDRLNENKDINEVVITPLIDETLN